MSTRKATYVPILKTKAGERWALSHLKSKTRSRIAPLMEFHDHKTKALGDHVGSTCEALEAAWGCDYPFYADTVWLHGGSGSPATIAAVFESTEEFGLQAIPVVRTTYEDAALDQLRAVVAENERGCLLRVTPSVLHTPQLIVNVLDALEILPSFVDLLLDYRGRAMSLAEDVVRVPHIDEWRSFVAASGVFPASLTNLPKNKWEYIRRNDWLSWLGGVEGELPRAPIFSDYTMRSPGAPTEFGDPRVNLRYAASDRWSVQVGGRHKEGAAPEIYPMCRQLIQRDEYSGDDFSKGDEVISLVANGEESSGGPTQWLQWCVSHHIEFVVNQISAAGA